MINVELSTLIGFLLALLVLIAFILNIVGDRTLLRKEKKIDIAKKKCEICGFSSFLNSKGGYWRCIACESLNKE